MDRERLKLVCTHPPFWHLVDDHDDLRCPVHTLPELHMPFYSCRRCRGDGCQGRVCAACLEEEYSGP